MTSLLAELPSKQELFGGRLPLDHLLSYAAAIDPGLAHRAAVVTTDGNTLLTEGRYSKPDEKFIEEIVDFLSENRILVVTVGDPQGQFEFPIAALRHACWEKGILPVLGSEYCTSRKCPRCHIHQQFEDRIFVCQRCGLTLDRDLAGALNIYQRVFGKRSRLPEGGL
uniref:Transposase, IS605 OrfB n=1 Tax=Leptospirillum ferrodiazotrophum TaxID=412449 RepID=C6HVZ6_9BACT|nr:MAG: transposase, IS605 OrfB [Leptospirillum ferrodiazotrophum]